MTANIAALDGACNNKVEVQHSAVSTLYTASDILRDARMSICTALVAGGPESALAAIASSSIRLARWCVAGEMLWSAARRMLLQVSVSLKLDHHFGKGTVHVAINAGPLRRNVGRDRKQQ